MARIVPNNSKSAAWSKPAAGNSIGPVPTSSGNTLSKIARGSVNAGDVSVTQQAESNIGDIARDLDADDPVPPNPKPGQTSNGNQRPAPGSAVKQLPSVRRILASGGK